MRFLSLALLLALSAPLVSAQATDASLALGPELATLTPGTQLSVEQLADLGIVSPRPGIVVEVAASAQPTLGYELPVMAAKDVTTATLIGILIAGGGQIYAGELNRGLTIFGVAVAGSLAGAFIGGPAAFAGFGVAVAAWIYGILDADDAVRRVNAGGGMSFAPGVIRTPDGAAAPALSLAMKF